MNARQKIDKLMIDHQKEFGFHSNFDFMNELLAEIEKERDEFALGLLLHTGNMKLSLGKDDKERREIAESILEQYKKTL